MNVISTSSVTQFEGATATGRFRLTAAGQNVWRLQTPGTDGRFDDEGAVQRLGRELDGRLPTAALPLTVFSQGDDGRIRVIPDGHDDAMATVHPVTGEIRLVAPDAALTVVLEPGPPDGMMRVAGRLVSGEKLFGTGERFNRCDQRGKTVAMWAEDRWCQREGNSYVPIPFFLSTSGYGVLLNRFEGAVFDLGHTDPGRWTVRTDRAPLDLYFFLDPSPVAILEKLAALTGPAPQPPEWAFGVHICRHLDTRELGSAAGIREVANKMAEHDLPWSSVCLEGWEAYDTASYPALREIVHDLHTQGKKVLLYEACGRVPADLAAQHPEFVVADAAGERFLAEADADNPADAPDRKRSRFLDITHPGAVAWWQNQVWGPLVREIGIDGAKIDFCEQFPEWDSLRLADGRPAAGMHHYYPVAYNAMMHRFFNAHRPEGGMCWSRGGQLGAHRYPFLWCGDQLREWHFLQAILTATLSSGLSGLPFMGHDLAGYLPAADAARDPEAPVFIRGAQLACFGLNMQTHGKVTRPYDFDGNTLGLYRLYSKIHYALIPYLREQAETACRTGLPLVRHLYLGAPADETVWDIDDQYLLGADLLVAPILNDAVSRDLYLPPGDWRDLYDGTAYPGGAWLRNYPAPLERIPVFVAAQPVSRQLPAALTALRTLFTAAVDSLDSGRPQWLPG